MSSASRHLDPSTPNGRSACKPAEGHVLSFAIGLAISRLSRSAKADIRRELAALLAAVERRCSSGGPHVEEAKAKLKELLLALDGIHR